MASKESFGKFLESMNPDNNEQNKVLSSTKEERAAELISKQFPDVSNNIKTIVHEIEQIRSRIDDPISKKIKHVAKLEQIQKQIDSLIDINEEIKKLLSKEVESVKKDVSKGIPKTIIKETKKQESVAEKIESEREKEAERRTSKIISFIKDSSKTIAQKVGENAEKAAFGLVSFLGNSPYAHAITQLSIKTAKGLAERIKEYREKKKNDEQIIKGQQTEVELIRQLNDAKKKETESISNQKMIESRRDSLLSRTTSKAGLLKNSVKRNSLGMLSFLGIGLRMIMAPFRMILLPIKMLTTGASMLIEVGKTALSAFSFLKNTFLPKGFGGKALKFIGGRLLPVAGSAAAGYEIGSYINEHYLTNDKGEGILANKAYDFFHGDEERKRQMERERKRKIIAKQHGFNSWQEFVEHNRRLQRAKAENMKKIETAKKVEGISQLNKEVSSGTQEKENNSAPVVISNQSNVNNNMVMPQPNVRDGNQTVQKMILGLGF